MTLAPLTRAAAAAVLAAAASCTWPIPIGVQDPAPCGEGGRLGRLEVDRSFATCGAFVLDVGGVDNVDYGVQGLATQADGRIVLVGAGGTPLDTNFLALRLLETGALDRDFGDAGLVEVGFGAAREVCQAVVLQPDGRLLMAGEARQPGLSPAIARLLPDGTVDPSFRAGRVELGTNQALFNGAVVLPDGRIRAAGQGAPAAGSPWDLQVYGLLADGSLDAAFAAGGLEPLDFTGQDEFGGALISDSAGRLLVPGMGFAGARGFDSVLGRLLGSGLPDPSFGDGGQVTTDFFGEDDSCDEVAVQPDGKLVCGGLATRGGTPLAALSRYLADGTADATFGTGGKVTLDLGAASAFHAVKVLADGRIVAGGSVRSARGDDDLLLAIFSTSGAQDTSEGPATLAIDVAGGSVDSVNALLPDDRGGLLVYGATASRADNDLLLLRLGAPAARPPPTASYQLGCASSPVGAGAALFLLGVLPWVTRRRAAARCASRAP